MMYAQKIFFFLGVVVHTCNSSTQEVKVGGLQVLGYPGIYSKTLSKKERGREKGREEGGGRERERERERERMNLGIFQITH
jgi:hypothetical protein